MSGLKVMPRLWNSKLILVLSQYMKDCLVLVLGRWECVWAGMDLYTHCLKTAKLECHILMMLA